MILAVCVLLTAACGSEKAIKKGDQYAAVMEYYEAAKEYKKGYRKISPKERTQRAEVAWKMGECYRKSYNAVMALQGNGYENVYNIAGSFLGICLYEYYTDVTTGREPIVTKYNFK